MTKILVQVVFQSVSKYCPKYNIESLLIVVYLYIISQYNDIYHVTIYHGSTRYYSYTYCWMLLLRQCMHLHKYANDFMHSIYQSIRPIQT